MIKNKNTEIKDKLKKEDKKKLNLEYRKIFLYLNIIIQKKNWVLTVIIFLLVFIFAVSFWYKNILNSAPKKEIVDEFQAKQNQLDQKTEKIEKIIEKIQERESNFNNDMEYSENLEIIFGSEDNNTQKDQGGETTLLVN